MRYDKSAGLFPEGEYDATIIEAVEKNSKAGNPMIEITVRVYGSNGKKIDVLDWVQEAVIWKMRHLSKIVGHDFESGVMTPSDLINQNVRVKLQIAKNPEFGEQNKIYDYVGVASVVGTKDDDIPF